MRPDRREMPRRRSHLRRQPAARPPDRQADRRVALTDSLLLHLAAGHLVELRGNRLVAGGADAVAELRLGVVGDVAFDLLPVLIVPANALAVAADRQQPMELLHIRQRLLQFADAFGPLL